MLGCSVVTRCGRLVTVVLVLALVALGSVFAGGASAASVRCGAVITQSIVLAADVGPCPGDGLVIGADNITVDLNGKRVYGTAGSVNGNAAGIRLPARTGVTVRRGTVSGFDAGVLIDRGSANTVRNLVVRDNISFGGDPEDPEVGAELGDGIVVFNSADNRILSNLVKHNGFYDGIGIWGHGSDRNVVQRNLVEDTLPDPDDPTFTFTGTGIIVVSFLEGSDTVRGLSVHNNKVLGNVVRRNGNGISNISNVNGVVVGNLVEDNGLHVFGALEDLPANGIGVQRGTDATDETRMVVERNKVSHNGITGIFLNRFVSGNRVRYNQVLRNGVAGIFLARGTAANVVTYNDTGYNGVLDLVDLAAADGDTTYRDAPCIPNRWFANTWGPPQPNDFSEVFPVPYFPDCVTAGGSGPNPPPAAELSGGSAAKTATDPHGGDDTQPPLPRRQSQR